MEKSAAIFCGILIYVAVYVYNNKKSVLGVILGIPAFIVSGYEHSIADMFYFAASGIASWQAFGYIWIIILGNSVGGLLIPALQLLANVTLKKNAATSPEQECAAQPTSDLAQEAAADITVGATEDAPSPVTEVACNTKQDSPADSNREEN